MAQVFDLHAYAGPEVVVDSVGKNVSKDLEQIDKSPSK
jgi:hypothetical protein